jgi:large subunit ribosomal protein L17
MLSTEKLYYRLEVENKMRHKVDGRLFGRPANQRKALLRGLVTSLFEHERIETTVAKAKEVRRLAEKIITLGLKGDLHAKRLAFSYLSDRASLAKLFSEIAPRFSGRNGGYLRIIQTRNRVNDSARMAVLEFVDFEETRKTKEPKKKKPEKKKAEKPSS